MRTETVLITPQTAKNLLECNLNNRRLRLNHVEYLSNELLAGRWRHSHQGIAISADGMLLDGQHRLTAIAKTGVSAVFNVSYDCDPSMFAIIDTGASRGAADVLNINGLAHSHQTTIAACVRLYWLYTYHPNKVWTSTVSRVSPGVVLEEFKQNENNFIWAAKLSNCVKNEFNLMSYLSSIAAFASLGVAHGYTHEEIEHFLQTTATGDNLTKGDPRFTFRRQLINNWKPAQLLGCRDSQAWLACLIKIFNLYNSSVTVKIFKMQTLLPMPKFG